MTPRRLPLSLLFPLMLGLCLLVAACEFPSSGTPAPATSAEVPPVGESPDPSPDPEPTPTSGSVQPIIRF